MEVWEELSFFIPTLSSDVFVVLKIKEMEILLRYEEGRFIFKVLALAHRRASHYVRQVAIICSIRSVPVLCSRWDNNCLLCSPSNSLSSLPTLVESIYRQDSKKCTNCIWSQWWCTECEWGVRHCILHRNLQSSSIQEDWSTLTSPETQIFKGNYCYQCT